MHQCLFLIVFVHGLGSSDLSFFISFKQDKMPQTPPFPVMYGSNGYNMNIYKAKEEDYEGLYYHENNLVSGSLEALIEHLVPTVAYYPDVSI